MLIRPESDAHKPRRIIDSNGRTAIAQATANHHFGLPLAIQASGIFKEKHLARSEQRANQRQPHLSAMGIGA